MRRAEPIAGLGGLLLLVSLFLPWRGDDTDPGVVIDIVLALLALLALAVPVVSLATRGPAASVGTAVVASAFGWIAIVIVAIELLAGHRETGVWLALAGSILAWVGSWLSLRDESTPGAVAPEVPRRPAPPKITA
jgi:hypothetical protein